MIENHQQVINLVPRILTQTLIWTLGGGGGERKIFNMGARLGLKFDKFLFFLSCSKWELVLGD